MDPRSLCVYCGSSGAVDPRHLRAADELGRLAADRGIEIVFGGGHVGLMGALADGALAAGGRVIGVIPEHLQSRELGHRGIDELIVVDSMHTRKRRMFELSDAFCVLPGGLGTLDETIEIVTWRRLDLHDKPVVLVNLEGYWTPLLKLLDHQSAAGYLRPRDRGIFRAVENVTAVFDAIAEAPTPRLSSDSDRL